MKQKSEFESRIEFKKEVKKFGAKKYTTFYATIYWNNEFHEIIKSTKELCIEELKRQCNYND